MQTVSRLIDFFVPKSYDLSLTIEREKRSFHGTVTIHGESVIAKEIRLHSKDLTIHSVTFDGKLAEFATSDNDELVIGHPDMALGGHVVVVMFSGTMRDSLRGMYPSYYDHDGMKKELIVTQLESHHAREVFPCIDEPAAKALFNVSLTTELNVVVLGNMPIISQRVDPEGLVTTFATTPRMSTYLLAWVIGELEQTSAKTKRGIDVSIWSTPAQPAASREFALSMAIRLIDFYEEYFETEYPLPKSDHVAIPDFDAGAMENWGLITYREIALLADPQHSSIYSRRQVALVIAHELAHQWFGNLVTMQWWDDLWLNESFANMMEYLAVDALEPSWQIWLDFSTQQAILALRRDSIDGVQAVKTAVHHPDEINSIFDPSIVYAKGGRLLRMVEQYIGEDAFRKALKAYFLKHAYANTVGDDLWHAMDDASGQDISSLMTTWLTQPGYPVIHAKQIKDQIQFSQEQFFVGPHTESTRSWPVPLDGSSTIIPPLFSDTALTISASDNFLLNVHDSAHFITDYDETLRQSLYTRIQGGSVDDLNRLKLLNEATLLARGGMLQSAQLIDLINVYKNETVEQVWTLLFITLAELRVFVENDEPAEKALRRLSGNIARQQYDRLGWETKPDESEDDTKLRPTIISMMLYSEEQTVIDEAKRIYDTTPLEKIDPELRSLIISSVSRYSDGSIVDSLITAYKTTPSPELQNDIAVGVTSIRVPEKIDQLLALLKDMSTIRPQDATHWFVYLVRGRDSKAQAWRWVRDNWQWLLETFKKDKSYETYPRYIAGALSTKEYLNEFRDFFTPMRDDPGLQRVIDMGISEIEGRIELIEREGDAVRKKLVELD